ncbi:hypothetical protein [Pseudomonas allokribbensis]|uniref:hypothetical protein n=1 Tax=Pseudomonas allokribbensis TaxID=2774460 RepID=UPI0017889B90|nr:hypothetical protein [Pseudomonas allokribbensis]
MFLFCGVVRFFEFLIRAFSGVKLLAGVVVFMLPGQGNANSYDLVLSNLSNSYSGCYYRDNGNGTSSVFTVIDYKPSYGHTGGLTFRSRGILVYSYDKNGKLRSTSTPATNVSINGVRHTDTFVGNDYFIFFGRSSADWISSNAFSASVTATVRNDLISDWPAVAIRAGNFTNGPDVAEIKGVAYISRYGANDGTCQVVVEPGMPPPPDISISVSAPDWNLGDLQRGVSDTQLSRTDQTLCFSYNPAVGQGQKFIIGASSANGVVNNRYRLQHLSESSQVVPYSLMLDSGSTRIQLPGNSNAMTLDTSGRTCFVPTFTTEVGKTVKAGDYSDVLTFTVITKS